MESTCKTEPNATDTFQMAYLDFIKPRTPFLPPPNGNYRSRLYLVRK